MPGLKKIMKVASSLKSLKKRDLNSKLVKLEEVNFTLLKKNPRFKASGLIMSDQDYKETWKGFTKFILWEQLLLIAILVILALTLL